MSHTPNFKEGDLVKAHIYPAPVTARILHLADGVAMLDHPDEAGRPLTVYTDRLTKMPEVKLARKIH